MGKQSVNQKRAKEINMRLTLGKKYTYNEKKISKVELESGSAILAFKDSEKEYINLKELKTLHENANLEKQ